jgi:polyhydroxyalkanoate synthase
MTNVSLPNPLDVTITATKIAGQSRRLILDYMQRQAANGKLGMHDMTTVGNAFLDMTTQIMTQPEKLVGAQMGLWQDYLALWQNSMLAIYGSKSGPLADTDNDRRFKHDDWQDNILFEFIKQGYLLTARWVLATVREVEGLDDKTARKVDFYVRQFVDALSPTNFVLTNPEVLRTVAETGGQSLLNGLSNLLDDLERGNGKLAIKMTDLEAFELGENVATTPGKVVFQTELMQLIQYAPSTKQVRQRPLLIVPPWINKFYILDLQPRNSLISWAVDQGHTVFVISWVNPDGKLAEKDFEDYLTEGTLAALDAIEKITGERQVNGVGYCLGGTLLMSTVAYLTAKRQRRIASATCLTTLLDFSEPGELEVFLDEDQISSLEKVMDEQGYLDGAEMATTFNMLRANDLIWSFFINNYLLGKEPFPFDLLYWNSDSTRMPARMHSFYLRNMYLENNLVKPGGIELNGIPIDLGKVKVPVYYLSTIEDHIAPWRATYAGTQLTNGPVKFVLGGSGHIAGVINPPNKQKYGYWTNEELPPDPSDWFQLAQKNDGSWWVDWDEWLKQYAGDMVPAREPGSEELPPVEDAPGSYVKLRLAK